MSTAVWEYFTSALVSKNSRHLLKKSADTKPVTTKSPAFSRALDNVVAFTMNSRGLLKLFSFFFRLAVVFTLVFVLRHSVEKHSIQKFFFLLFLIGKRRHSVTTSSLINLLILFQLQISLT